GGQGRGQPGACVAGQVHLGALGEAARHHVALDGGGVGDDGVGREHGAEDLAAEIDGFSLEEVPDDVLAAEQVAACAAAQPVGLKVDVETGNVDDDGVEAGDGIRRDDVAG